ncbi:histidine--tRNA ligase [Deinococcus piscis]|uniref:Histidine--tRNA ligase n=1 Tax=Deinococcus piscis TaxID=394230 RepID=A0ABQ3KE05_9DEIO|nr:histidine--tRNA ligase [Deinococcus piscis]GHG06469.1 histidine--tRNA ligase [Deinococcus piscis]
MAIQRPKGTKDHLPGTPGTPEIQAAAHAHIQHVAAQLLERAGAQFIATPIFEEAELVQRGVGGSTDIVRKEMFTVYYAGDHGGYVLRPEGTAPVVRAYLENGLKQLGSPLKLWTHGPMFRAENVQKGRLRQFHQVDYECLGSTDPLADAEAIALMWDIVTTLGLKGVSIQLGSIGDPEDRAAYNDYLRGLFTPRLAELSEDSKDRLSRNPMRILDSKSETDQAIIAELNVKPMLDFLGAEARDHFGAVQGHLQAWGVPFEIDPSIVRGLDYYRRTAWELHHAGIGAKSALGGGGRYDGLAQELGAKEEVPGIGWAFGIERILLAMADEGVPFPQGPSPALYLAALDGDYIPLAAALTRQARAVAGADFSYRKRGAGQAFKEADKKGATWAAVIGSNEAAQRQLTLKHLGSGEQVAVPFDELNTFLKENA